jgi:hypothetical protein
VVPPLLLAIVAAVVLVARLVALRRITLADRTKGSIRGPFWRWCGLTVATLLLLGAAARPVFGLDAEDTRVAGDGAPNVFLVVDRSPDMAVTDIGDRESRISLARRDIAAVIDRYPDARFAEISFAARPSLDWPLSSDAFSLRPVMSALTPYPIPSGELNQNNVGAAATVLRYQLIAASQLYPRAENLVFYFGAGAPESEAPQRNFELPEESVDGGGVLGYGTADGGPVPGSDRLSGVNEPALRGVAEQIGVPYVARTEPAPLDDVLPVTDVAATEGSTASPSPDRTEVYWAYMIGAAVLVLIELYLVLREFRRTRLARVELTP